jgi:hypothetical protein
MTVYSRASGLPCGCKPPFWEPLKIILRIVEGIGFYRYIII